MKHVFKPALGLVSLLFITTASNSQNQFAGNTGTLPFSQQSKSAIASEKTISSNSNAVLDSITSSNPKLEKAFSTLFPSAVQQKWGKLDKGYYVAFVNNGLKTSACFNLDGILNYVISECPEEQLPVALRAEIHKNYPGYKLLSGTAIQAYGTSSYQAILEGGKDYITLKCAGGEIEKTQQITKAIL